MVEYGISGTTNEPYAEVSGEALGEKTDVRVYSDGGLLIATWFDAAKAPSNKRRKRKTYEPYFILRNLPAEVTRELYQELSKVFGTQVAK